jgi:HEAT repeat protein
MEMLKGLEDVAWAKYDHAYGPADDVPDLIRALASQDREARARAQYDLYGTLWNQGTVYQATQFAVPYLVELLEESDTVDRPWLLIYLSALAHGASHHEIHQDLMLYDGERDTPEFRAKIVRELEWVAAANIAVRRGLDVYRRLLTHDDPSTRASAAYLLGGLRQETATTVPVLKARLDEEEDIVARASIAEALGSLGDEPLIRMRLLDLVQHDVAPYVRWAAARTLAFLAGDGAPEGVEDALIELLGDPSMLEEYHSQSPWAEDNTPGATAQALLALGPERARPGLSVLVQILPQCDPSSALSVAQCMLAIAFPFSHGAPEPAFAELEEDQKEAVRALAYSDTAWAMRANMAALLGRHKLPRTSEALQSYAGLPIRRVGADAMFGGPGETMALFGEEA